MSYLEKLRMDIGVEAVGKPFFVLKDRDSEEVIAHGHYQYLLPEIIKYLKVNPDATLCLYKLEDRFWVCKSTGNIRSDHINKFKESE